MTSRTIHGRIFEHGERRPEAPFVTVLREHATETLSYSELISRSEGWAATYTARGVGRGEVVAIVLPQSTALFTAFLGALVVGAIPALLPPPSNKQAEDVFWRVQEATLSQMPAALIVTDSANGELVARQLPEYAERIVVAGGPPTESPSSAAPAVSDADVAFLQYSSGTTGLKKGVALTHRAVLAQIDAYARALHVTPADRVASWLPYYHDMGLIACFLLPAVKGLSVVCLDPFEWALRPSSLLDVIADHACTLTWLPNFAFHHIVRAAGPSPRRRLESLRACVDCSEPCRAETLELFQATFAGSGLRPEALQVCYAMAENVFAVTQTSPSEPPRVRAFDRVALESRGVAVAPRDAVSALRLVSCGRPLETARVAILGEDGRELAEAHVGAIAVGGDTLFRGYHGARSPAPDLHEGWFRTTDRGFVLDGELYVTGRSEDVLVISGRNLYAHDVEQVVNLNTPVKPGRCIALGVFNPEKGSDDLTLVVEMADGGAESGIRRRIAEVVSNETGISVTAVRFVEPGWLLKTTSGKLSRRANLDKYRATF